MLLLEHSMKSLESSITKAKHSEPIRQVGILKVSKKVAWPPKIFHSDPINFSLQGSFPIAKVPKLKIASKRVFNT